MEYVRLVSSFSGRTCASMNCVNPLCWSNSFLLYIISQMKMKLNTKWNEMELNVQNIWMMRREIKTAPWSWGTASGVKLFRTRAINSAGPCARCARLNLWTVENNKITNSRRIGHCFGKIVNYTHWHTYRRVVTYLNTTGVSPVLRSSFTLWDSTLAGIFTNLRGQQPEKARQQQCMVLLVHS